MSRSKQLWEAECEQICRDYQDGKISLDDAAEALHRRGWPMDEAMDELAVWAES